MSKIYTREVANDIVNTFEDLLDEHNIVVPDEDRNGDEDEGALYGDTFSQLLDKIECIVIELMEICNIDYQPDEWDGGNWIK